MNKKISTKKLTRILVLVSSFSLSMVSVPSTMVTLASEATTSTEISSSNDVDITDNSLNDLRDPLSSVETTAETANSTSDIFLDATTLSTTDETTLSTTPEDQAVNDQKELVEETDETEEVSKTAKVDLKAEGVAAVTNWESFAAALGDRSVHTISLANDIILSGDLANIDNVFDRSTVNVDRGMSYIFVNKGQISRKLVIDGTNPANPAEPYTFDFGTLAIGFNNGTLSGTDWDITMQNIDVKTKVNYHGPFFFPRIAVGDSANGLNTRLANQKLTYGSNYLHTRYITTHKEFYYAMVTISVNKIEFTQDIIAVRDPGKTNMALREAQVADINNAATNASENATRDPDNTGGQWVYMNSRGSARELYVEGNGFIWDAGGLVFCYRNPTVVNNKGWDITLANMETFHTNYYGNLEYHDMNATNQGLSLLTYKDFTNRGTQLTESQYSVIEFEGTSDIRAVREYTPVGSDGTVYGTRKPADPRQQGLAIAKTTFKENSKVYISSLAGIGLQLREAGDMVLEKGADVTVVREGNGTSSAVEGASAAIEIANGSLTVKDGATLNAFSKADSHGTALSLKDRNSSVLVDKGGSLNVETENFQSNLTGSERSLVYMGGGSLVINGELNAKAINQGTSRSDLIYGNTEVSFVIGREGKLDIQSDSTDTAQSMINLRNSSSEFRFSDAKRVNLQRTKPVNNANGLISMNRNGTLSVAVQNVYQWQAGNIAGGLNAEDGGYDHAYEPMSNMKLIYNGTSLLSKTGNSMFSETKNRFDANFTTEGQQRILYEYVPAPSVEIQSISNDNPTEPDSMTIKGYARPNTYVRLWEEAKNGTTSSLVKGTEDTIKTPIDDPSFDINAVDGDGNPMYSDDPTKNYTVIADANGDWSYKIKKSPDQWFTANNVIHAFGFNNLKSEEKTQIVLDKTAPTAKPVKYYVVKGDVAPQPNLFVKDAKDTNPVEAEAKINYAYNSATDIATLMETVSSEANPHKVKIDVSDSAIDPVTGDPMPNTATIDAELVVLSQPITIDMNAEEITVEYKDIREFTDEQLKQWVIDTSEATGYKVDRGGVVDLTDKIIVSDLGQLNEINAIVAADGNMVVTLTIPKEDSGLATDYSATIKVKVINLLSTLTVEFVNEDNQVMDGYTLTITKKDGELLVVSDKLDLTEEQYGISAQIEKLVKAGYKVETRPEKETAFVLDNTEVTATYKVTGLVYLASRPETIDFGEIVFDAKVQQVDENKRTGDLVVNDTRVEKSKWSLGAKVTTEMNNNDTQNPVVLLDSLYYFHGKNKDLLSKDLQQIYQGEDKAITDISATWGPSKDSDGLKLVVDPSINALEKGTYAGVIEWQFMPGSPGASETP